MVKYIFYLLSLIAITISCGQEIYKIEKDEYGEPLLNGKAQYTFNQRPSEDDLQKIDTSDYYVQIFTEDVQNSEIINNPRIIIFHNDGFFKNESLLYFGKFDAHRGKNSAYYGGKYRIKENQIHLEQFESSPDAKKFYSRRVSIGEILGDKIIFKNKNDTSIFEKRKRFP
jgi:hypothetical protein